VNALSRSDKTGAILVDAEKCISCSKCISACPGRVPFLHPATNKATICDLCDGAPECARVCQEGRYNALWTASGAPSKSYKLYAKTPDKVTEELAARMYKDLAKELV
jgi:Fe-S-cluster-containing dehydrogenase component